LQNFADDHPFFNPVEGCPPDYLHQADIGVFKRLVEWLQLAILERDMRPKPKQRKKNAKPSHTQKRKRARLQEDEAAAEHEAEAAADDAAASNHRIIKNSGKILSELDRCAMFLLLSRCNVAIWQASSKPGAFSAMDPVSLWCGGGQALYSQ